MTFGLKFALKRLRALAWLALGFICVASGASTPAPSTQLPMLHTEGTRWLRSDGSPIDLKGVNLGNWLIQEFWMMGQSTKAMNDQCLLEATLDQRFGYAERERLMKLFRDNWMSQRDWDLLPRFGLNLVRLPFLWSVIEDEKNPRHLRADAWHYLDQAINQAEAHGMYVILDLHGAAGSQSLEHHSGCVGRNLYWTTPEYQERTTWLWQQIAARYKDRSAVAGYSLLNEPWGTTEGHMAAVMKNLYVNVRAVDPNHVIILPGYHSGIDAYGDPAKQGQTNVAFEMHFYPGFFGFGKPEAKVHRDWLLCAPTGRNVCEWYARMMALDAAFYIGEFQPWAELGPELGGQITRVSYDTYAKYGWAATSWSYKVFNNRGGQGKGTWGLVTNADSVAVPLVDFAAAPKSEIEGLFSLFGSAAYEPQQQVIDWMNKRVAPDPFHLR